MGRRLTGLLLDTHALIWFATGDSVRMPAAVVTLISDPANAVFVSAASVWEIATKNRLGKLSGVEDILRQPAQFSSELGMTGLPIGIEHAARAGSFDVAHRDPFDRMLAAQAELQGLAIVSIDAALDVFGVDRLWDVDPAS